MSKASDFVVQRYFHICEPGVCITAKTLTRMKPAPKPGWSVIVVCSTLKQAWMKSQRLHLPRYLQPAVLFRQSPVRWHRVFQDRQSQSFSRQLQWPLDSISSPCEPSLRTGNTPSPPTASPAALMVMLCCHCFLVFDCFLNLAIRL